MNSPFDGDLSSKAKKAIPRRIVSKLAEEQETTATKPFYLFAVSSERRSNDVMKSEKRALREDGDRIGKIVLTVGE